MAKPIWESRFEGFAHAIEGNKQAAEFAMAKMAIEHKTSLDTVEYWKLVGRIKAFEDAERSATAWRRANWF